MRLVSLNQISRRLDDADSVIRALDAIGLPLPKYVPGLLSAEAHVGFVAAGGIGFSEAQVDAALAKTELPPGDRMTFKIALSRHKLLRKAA